MRVSAIFGLWRVIALMAGILVSAAVAGLFTSVTSPQLEQGAAVNEDLFQVTQIDELAQVLVNHRLAAIAETTELLTLPETYRQSASALYTVRPMAAALRAVVAQQMPTEHVAEVTAFFEAEPGRTLLAREIDVLEMFIDEAASEAAIENLNRLRVEDPDRIALLEDLEAAIGVVDADIQLEIAMSTIMFTATLEQEISPSGLTLEQFEDSIPDLIEGARPKIEVYNLALYLMAFRSVRDADIAAYIDFANSQAGRAWHRSIHMAAQAAQTYFYRQSAQLFAAELAG